MKKRWENLHIARFKNKALVLTLKLKAEEIETLKIEKKSLHSLIVCLHDSSKSDRMRRQSGDEYSELSLLYV